MPSTFFGLTIGTSGLFAAQNALNVTANNTANELTEGYTRQQAVQKQTQALRCYTSAGTMGTGVEISEIKQVREEYYDVKYRNNHTRYAEAKMRQNYVDQIQNFFNEVRVEGFTTEFSHIFSSLEDLKNDPSDLTVRNEFLNYCDSMADYINNITGDLQNLRNEINIEISNNVSSINAIIDEIATLTKQINVVELEGPKANVLRDERNLLVDELSQFIPVKVNEVLYENGKSDFTVTAGSFHLVESYEAHRLTAAADERGDYQIYMYYSKDLKTGTPFNIVRNDLDGSLRALFDLRDGNNGVASYDVTESFLSPASSSFATENTTKPVVQLGSGIAAGDWSFEDNQIVRIVTEVGGQEKVYDCATVNLEFAKQVSPADGQVYYIPETGQLVFGTGVDPATIKEAHYVISGESTALNDYLDGKTALSNIEAYKHPAVNYKGVGYFESELDDLKMILTREFNQVHYLGTDLNGNSTKGVNIFNYSYEGKLEVNGDLIKDTNLMATSTNKPQDGVQDSNLIEVFQKIKDSRVFNGSDCQYFMESMTTEVAMLAQRVGNQYDSYSNMDDIIKNQRLSISGVDKDEETANLIKFNEAYDLSSKVISVMAEILDKLINETAV